MLQNFANRFPVRCRAETKPQSVKTAVLATQTKLEQQRVFHHLLANAIHLLQPSDTAAKVA
jgi:hypothetical protein